MATMIETLCARLRDGEPFHDAALAVGIVDPARWWKEADLRPEVRRLVEDAGREGRELRIDTTPNPRATARDDRSS